MFNWLRGLTTSAETRRQERTIAYVDGKLSEKESLQFAAEMARDAALQADVAELQQIKATLQAVPRQTVPRNFILDPAAFVKIKPKPAYDVRFYPVLRAATALSALLFIIMATLTLAPTLNLVSLKELASAPTSVEINDTLTMAEPVEEKIVEESVDPAPEPMLDAAAAESAIAPMPTSEHVEQAEEAMAESAVEELAEPEEAEITANEVVEDSADELANSGADAAPAAPDTVGTASDGANAGTDDAAEPTPAPIPTLISAPREVIPPSAATSATESGEFRVPPVAEPAISADVVEADRAVGLAPIPTDEASRDNFGHSTVNDEGEGAEVVSEVSNAERVDAMKVRPKTVLTIALALLFTLLLATTLWIRSRL